MSLHHLPRYVPALSTLLDDLGRPAPLAWALALGISERTAWRWQTADAAPLAARLALYWVTHRGWSEHRAEGQFALDTMHALCDAYRRQIAALQGQSDRLQRLGHFGSANDPVAGHISRLPASLPLLLDPGLQARQAPDDGRRDDGPRDDEQRLAADG